MPFFDFHCHPSLKQMLSAPGENLTPWHDLKVKLKIGKLFGRETSIGINSLFNGVFNSQSNLKQMQRAGVQLAGVVIYSIENKIAQGILERKIASSGKINLMDPAKMRELQSGNNYYEWTKRTMDALVNNPSPPAGIAPKSARFKFINKIEEFDRNDTNTVHGILILEGLHDFCNDPFSADAEAEFDANFADFQQRYNTRIFAVNIPHMQDFPAANHAFGMQIIKEELFYPNGSGLTEWGKRLVKKLYDNKILIDFKHMSFYTRTQLIAQRSLQGFEDIPLICTHAGLTGCHSDNRYKYLNTRPKLQNGVWRIRHHKLKGSVQDSAFNLSSINLYDDEIIRIIRSKGLIGISLDQRILGFPTDSVAYQLNDYPYDQEFVAHSEDEIFFRGYDDPADIPFYIPGDDVLTGDEALVHGENSFEYHYYYFLNQVFHILQVAKKAGIPISEAARCICIGSDFDGLINTLDCCRTVEELGGFKTYLRQILTRRPSFWQPLSIRREQVDADDLLEGIFFNNALDFLKVNFK
ncbi:membrane dipeptidase [Ferruginibacter sp. HRS2-29]|uniref:membrane dipeptidase n=1 Tax=Ferruginibacter sp. HRS2-29 TaxID=2487334 RepID=UPI0020CD18E7|nr:membrane dipeptidase [Ferruginibacter sp. HRS2-29]MCP9753012.1 hypothetical protein [Ferruginibacter sp. HRS2-29]